MRNEKIKREIRVAKMSPQGGVVRRQLNGLGVAARRMSPWDLRKDH
jgi:hypothetical protein